MKKSILVASLVAGSMAAHAAVITYNFDTGMGDTTSGSDLTAGDIAYAIGTNSDGEPTGSDRAWNPTSASGEYELNMGQRGVGNSGITDAALATGAASQLTFTLTPNAGESLSFATSSLDFTGLFYSDIASGTMAFAYKVWADTGSGLTAVGALQSYAVATAPDTQNILLQTDEVSALTGFAVADGGMSSYSSAFSFDVSSLGALAADQDVTFAITLSGNRNNQFAWGNSIDDITLDNITVIPEPATLGLVVAMGGSIIFIRRRFMI